jgi:hypothetical protein
MRLVVFFLMKEDHIKRVLKFCGGVPADPIRLANDAASTA